VRRILLPIFLMLVSQAPLQAAPATTSTYEIEVVVFENRLADLEGSEFWTRTGQEPAGAEKDQALIAGEKPPPDSSLSAAAAALERSGRHHVLTHLRWQQSAEAKSVSKPVRLISAGGELDGALRFYLSRYLIVELNMVLREPPGGGFFGAGQEQVETPYRLNESRRIKVSETHYFDHPKFGALVRVSPAKAAGQP